PGDGAPRGRAPWAVLLVAVPGMIGRRRCAAAESASHDGRLVTPNHPAGPRDLRRAGYLDEEVARAGRNRDASPAGAGTWLANLLFEPWCVADAFSFEARGG